MLPRYSNVGLLPRDRGQAMVPRSSSGSLVANASGLALLFALHQRSIAPVVRSEHSDSERSGSLSQPQTNAPELLLWKADTQVPDSSAAVDGGLDFLRDLIGAVSAPSDWASEHDHYLYGSPRRGRASDGS